MDGIFLDEVAHDVVHLPYYVALRRAIGDAFVVLNPGTVPARGYFALADVVVTYEGPFADYARRLALEPGWLRDVPPAKTAHLVYAATRDEAISLFAAPPRARLAVRHLGLAPEPLGRAASLSARRASSKEFRMFRPVMLIAFALAVAPAAASAQAPLGPPGPPPGNGTDLPAPPGTAPAFVPPGTAAAIPGGAPGPGLLQGHDGRAQPGRSARSRCRSRARATGTLQRDAKRRPGTLARASYRCVSGRATARLTLSKKVAAKVAKRRVVAATATIRQGARTRRGSRSRSPRASRPRRPRRSGPTGTCSARRTAPARRRRT